MAESVVKLRLESGEYDSKIKRATENVRNFGENCQRAGQSVAKADKETLDYVRSIGQMETVAKNIKGKIGEMTTAFTELTVQYKRMTQEEKNSPFGQALFASLDNLKTRISESKDQLDEVNRELGNTSQESNSTGGVLENLAGKFGLNVSQAGAFGAALGAATVATKVAKDAFFSNEAQLDEWGRTVESAHSVYRGFLDALNTGDISGFLNRIDTIVSAARKAYDALDNLATFNAFNQVNVARTRQTFLDAQNDFREGTGSKEQVISAGEALKGELEQRRQLEKKAYVAEIVKLANERDVNPVDLARVMLGNYGDYEKIKATPLTGTRTETVTTQYGGKFQRSWAVAANETERMGAMLRRFNDTELQHLQGLGAQFFNTGFEKSQIDRQINRIVNGPGGGGGGGTARPPGGGGTRATPLPQNGSIAAQEAKVQALTKAWRNATDQAGRDGYLKQLEEAKTVLDEMQGKVEAPAGSMKALNDELSDLQQKQQMVNSAEDWQTYEERIKGVKQQMSDLKGVVQEMATGFSGLTGDSLNAWMGSQRTSLGGMEIGSGSYMQTMGNIIDTQTLQNVLNATIAAGVTISPDTLESLWEQILGGENVPDSVWEQLQETINDAIAELGIDPIKIDVNTGTVTGLGKQVTDSWSEAARAVQSVGSAMSQLEDPAAKVAGIVGQAIANIALGFAQATAASGKYGIFGWVAAIAGGLGTMISTISAIKSATAGSYAQGGIIPGNSFSGDQMYAAVNSGEVILNRAQSANIASQLTDTRADGGERQPYLDVETIWLGIGNLLKRRNMGEILTTKDLKRHGARL